MFVYNKKLQKKFNIDIEAYKKKSGKYKKGKKNGEGKEYFYDGKLKFEGEYLNGKIWNGKGYNKNGNMEFEIKDGKGKGKEYYDNDKLKFEGEYINGKRNSEEKEYYIDRQLKFEGKYSSDKKWDGKGY